MKIVVRVETYRQENRLTPIQWVAFSLGWFGMRPELFEKFPGTALPFTQLLFKGISRIIVGTVILYSSWLTDTSQMLRYVFIPQLLLLAGLSLILHFGVLTLSAAVWRIAGVNVSELFQSPYKSRSLKEFWGKRWNIAFSEMTALTVYRPLRLKFGIEKSLVTAFLFSGVLHEVAISLPVMTGFGLPMIYFMLQAVAMRIEARSANIQEVIRNSWLSHAWVMAWLLLPLPLLFHPIFMQRVLVPLRVIILHGFGIV